MLLKLKSRHLLACLMSACIVTPTFAQQQDSQSQRQEDSQQNQQNNQSNQRDSQSQKGSRIRVEPQGWVSMAVDYDNDGTYDGFETIYIYDLQMAQQRSRDRKQGQSGQQQDRQQMSQRQRNQGQMDQRRRSQQQDRRRNMDPRSTAQNQGQGQRRSPEQRLTGTVQDIQQITMRGENQPKFKVAKVKTQEGRTVRVLLGKSQQIDQLSLQDGDQIQVQGRRGRVNDRPVVVANMVRSGDQTARIEFDQRQPLRQFKGNVEQTRTARFQNKDGVYLIARMEGQDGRSHIVNFGRTGKVSPSAVKNADEVCVLATRGEINGQNALIAQEISIDGRKINVGGDERRPQSWTLSEQQNRDQQNRSAQSRSQQNQ